MSDVMTDDSHVCQSPEVRRNSRVTLLTIRCKCHKDTVWQQNPTADVIWDRGTKLQRQ